MNQHIYQGHLCPQCEADEAFISVVALGDYVEIASFTCPRCKHELTEPEKDAITGRAWEDAPGLYASERAEYMRGQ